MKGDFEQAVNNNEVSAYLKGEGDYFVTNDWGRGYHHYMMNFTGMLEYLKKKENPYLLLVKYFKLYLGSLNKDALDAWGLFNNISCYYYFRKNNRYFLTQNKDLIDELTVEEKKKIGVLFRYLRENFDKVPDSTNMRPIDEQMKFVYEDGCPYDLFSF
ncbi:hypothetical protein DKK70_16535 [Gilliamella apicola]|uniref:Uncharacterized protein n=1 Tax=Gilliamella apicola TaxID=1196095 RepID=A0A2V4DR79_9GAMM|nr:hypothetical protein [Gilliamella apicola]PXZ02853.1 hypothetical protein DKK70_16535 [Gilliamella apicola]